MWAQRAARNGSHLALVVADTVLFHDGAPSLWLFTDKDGVSLRRGVAAAACAGVLTEGAQRVRKRRKKNCTLDAVVEFFERIAERHQYAEDQPVAVVREVGAGTACVCACARECERAFSRTLGSVQPPRPQRSRLVAQRAAAAVREAAARRVGVYTGRAAVRSGKGAVVCACCAHRARVHPDAPPQHSSPLSFGSNALYVTVRRNENSACHPVCPRLGDPHARCQTRCPCLSRSS